MEKRIANSRMEGELLKRSEWVKRWDTRYFVLSASDRKLYYYAKKGDVKAKGSFTLKATGSVDTDAIQPGAFVLVPARGAKRVLLSAASVGARNKWLRAIQQVQTGGGAPAGASASAAPAAAAAAATARPAPATLSPPVAPSLPPPDASDPLSWMVDAAEEQEADAAADAAAEKAAAEKRRAAKMEAAAAAQRKREAAKSAAAAAAAAAGASAGTSPSWLVAADTPKESYAATDVGIRDAVKAGDLAGVQQLLAADAGLALRADSSGSALHLAAMFSHSDIALLLVAAGANPEAKNRSGESPIDLAGVVLGKKMVAAWEARR